MGCTLVSMKLSAYLELAKLDDAGFASKVGCDRSTIYRIRKSQTKPTPSLMQEIARETKGAVLPNDYFDGLPDEAAA
jgi:transcriptional regulator with XRE-family HTH domain